MSINQFRPGDIVRVRETDSLFPYVGGKDLTVIRQEGKIIAAVPEGETLPVYVGDRGIKKVSE